MTTGDGGERDWAAPGASVPPPGWSADQPPPSWAPPVAAQQPWMFTPPAPQPGIIPLRPLSVGELLDGSFTAMRRHPRVTLGLAAIVSAVQQLVSLGVDLSTGNIADPTGTGLSGVATVSGLISLAVNSLLSAVLLGMLTLVYGDAVLGRRTTLRELWTRLRPLFWPLVGAAFLATLLPILGLVALIVGGVFLWVVLSFTTPALVLERLRVMAALRRSWRLTLPAFWRVLGVRLLAMLLASVISTILALPGIIIVFTSASRSLEANSTVHFGVAAEIALRLSSLVATTITAPFIAGVLALLYIDRRMRAEALDLTLARAAGQTTPA